MKARYKLTIEYDGTNYHGWQKQENLPSVQETIEKAMIPIEGSKPSLYVAGRTDAGVHAFGQVAHVDLKMRDPYDIKRAVNYQLKRTGIVIVDVAKVLDDFHARFSATKRLYLYRIINRPEPLVLEAKRAWHVPQVLDVAAMQRGADFLIGHHNFTSFRASHCQAKSPMRTLDEFSFSQQGNLIEAHLKAPSFLHHQVRNMMGTLKAIGQGLFSPERIKEVLAAEDRRVAGITSPAAGLYLQEVWY